MSTVIVNQLRAQLRALEQGPLERRQRCISSTLSRLDEWLPQRGLAEGSFIEILQSSSGVKAYTLALLCGRQAVREKPAWAILDTEDTFNPVAAKALGCDLSTLAYIRSEPKDGGWAFAQLLRSKDLGVCVWASQSMDNMLFRRLQLAAERGGGLGFVIRPKAALRKPCWGSLRIHVSPGSSAGTVRLGLLHARGQPGVSRDEIEVAL